MTPALRGLVCACLLLAGCSDEIGAGAVIRHGSSLLEKTAKICILGDPGTGSRAQFAVARAAEKAGCTQVRILGDIIYPSGIRDRHDPLLQENFFRPYRKLLREAPFYLVQGNHDYILDDARQAWLDVAAHDSRIIYPRRYYAETWRDICFFSLDSTIYDKLYHVTERAPQTNWLQQAFRRANQQARCKFSVVFAHHPYRASGQHGGAGPLLGAFLESEIIGKVDLYVAGHDHILSDEGSADGTRLLVSGSAGRTTSTIDPSAGNRFAAARHGFIMLRFERGEGAGIVARYELCAVDVNAAEPVARAIWKGSISGQGLRL